MHYKSGENTLWGSLFKWWWPLQSSPYQVVEINSKFLLNFTWMGDLSNSLLEPTIFFCSARCINKINCQNHWQKTEETVKSLSVNKLVWIGYKTVIFHFNFLNFFSIYIFIWHSDHPVIGKELKIITALTWTSCSTFRPNQTEIHCQWFPVLWTWLHKTEVASCQSQKNSSLGCQLKKNTKTIQKDAHFGNRLEKKLVIQLH